MIRPAMTDVHHNQGWPRGVVDCVCSIFVQILFVIALLGFLEIRLCVAASGKYRPFLAREYFTRPSPESPDAAEQRHQLVAARRKGPIVIVHRGATAFAPENTLEAYAAAMDHGADGCEVDLRETADRVLVLFHDETLDRVTDGFGPVESVTFRQIENLRPDVVHGRALAGLVPSFAALLDLARERAMLLHLDLKVPGIEDEVARLLDEADAWDHVVYVNEANAQRLRQHPKLRMLRYKGPGLYERRLDMDPNTVARTLEQPGEMILVGDPRLAAMILGRSIYSPQPFSKTYRLTAKIAETTASDQTSNFNPMLVVSRLEEQFAEATPEALFAFFRFPKVVEGQAIRSVTSTELDSTLIGILTRAWAAQQIGLRGDRSKMAVALLEQLVRFPTWHTNRHYAALDGSTAIRALGRLRCVSSVRYVARWCWPEASGAFGDRLPVNANAYAQYRLALEALKTLSNLKCSEAKRVLKKFLNTDFDTASAPIPDLVGQATLALMQQKVSWDEIAELMRHNNPIVRGTAILECLNDPGEERLLALRTGAPWAMALIPRKR